MASSLDGEGLAALDPVPEHLDARGIALLVVRQIALHPRKPVAKVPGRNENHLGKSPVIEWNRNSLVSGELEVECLELGDGGQDGEVRDGDVAARHVAVGTGQEQIEVVQRSLQSVRLLLVAAFAGHQHWVLNENKASSS